MPKRGENIRRRKDGRWEGRYKSGIKSNGAAKYSSVYGKSYTEVKHRLLQAKREEAVKPIPPSEMSFEDILSLWLRSIRIKIKDTTEAKYRYMMETHIIPELGGMKISSINAPLINDFLFKKTISGRLDGKGGLSASYVRTMAIVIGSAMKLACTEGFCSNINGRIIKPTVPKHDPPLLCQDMQRKIESSAMHSPSATKTGILLALYAGLRIGEVCALSWDDIDLDDGIIHIRHTVITCRGENGLQTVIDTPKTKASVRDIPIAPMLLDHLKEMKGFAASRYVVSAKGSFVSTRTFDYRYKRILKELEIQRINFHALRHTFATRCIEAGVDAKSLSRILGHSDVTITLNSYVHPSFDAMHDQIQKLGALTEL